MGSAALHPLRRGVELGAVVADAVDQLARLVPGKAVLPREVAELIALARRDPAAVAPAAVALVVSHYAYSCWLPLRPERAGDSGCSFGTPSMLGRAPRGARPAPEPQPFAGGTFIFISATAASSVFRSLPCCLMRSFTSWSLSPCFLPK